MTTKDIKEEVCKLGVENADLSGSVFYAVNLSNSRLDGVNMSGVVIRNVDLTGASISDGKFADMLIDGILLTDLIACWSAHNGEEPNA